MGTLTVLVALMIVCMIVCAVLCMKEMSDQILEGKWLKVVLYLLGALAFLAIAFILGYCTSQL